MDDLGGVPAEPAERGPLVSSRSRPMGRRLSFRFAERTGSDCLPHASWSKLRSLCWPAPRTALKNGTVKTRLSGGYLGRYLATNGATGHLAYLRQGVFYAVPFDLVRLDVRGMPEPILKDVELFDLLNRHCGGRIESLADCDHQRHVVARLHAGRDLHIHLIQPVVAGADAGEQNWRRLAANRDGGSRHRLIERIAADWRDCPSWQHCAVGSATGRGWAQSCDINLKIAAGLGGLTTQCGRSGASGG